MPPLNPTTGQVLLQTANALSQTLQFQQQMLQRQQAQEETHQIQVANLKAKNEANELKLTLDKLKVESEQLGLREKAARTTKLEAEADLIARHGPVESARIIAAAQAAGKGGRGGRGNINFSEIVAASVGRGATRAFVSDLKGQGELSTKLEGLTQLDDGRTIMRTDLNTGFGVKKGVTIDYDHHIRQLGIQNPADLAELSEKRASLLTRANNLTDLTKFEGLNENERRRQEQDLREKIQVLETTMDWAHENSLLRNTDDLLELSGDKDILNLRALADSEPALDRTAVVLDMPATMSNQAKDHFFTQFADPEPDSQAIAAGIRQHYPKTPEGALDMASPEMAKLSQTLAAIHGEKFVKELVPLLLR